MNTVHKKAWYKKYDKDRHDHRERLGLCVVCGHARDTDGSGLKSSLKTCLKCRELRRGYSRNYYRTHSIVTGPGPVAINRSKTHCIRGHELPTPVNGRRICQPCKNLRKRIYRMRVNRELDNTPTISDGGFSAGDDVHVD